jgi:hypothetical protein
LRPSSQVGSVAGPDALVTVAKRAEDLGYDSLWILDRILWPINPRALYPIGDGSLPVHYKNVLDPMETLTFGAAHTSRIALGTGVLNLPWYNPVLLARQLTTFDILSAGRLRVGFGIGWSPDEYEAAGVALGRTRQTRRRVDLSPQENMDDRSRRVSRQVLSNCKILHRSKAPAETGPTDLHGRVCACRFKACCNRGQRLVSRGDPAK